VYHAPAFGAAEAVAVFLTAVTTFFAISAFLPIGLGSLIAAQLIGMGGVPLVWALARRRSLLRLGLGRPRLRHLAGAALLGATFWYASLFLLAPIITALDRGELRDIERHFIADYSVPARLVALGLVPALCEEIAARGVLARSLAPRSAPVAVAVSAIAFAGFHMAPSRLAPMLAFGAVLAFFAVRTGTIWPAIVAHFTNNAVALLWDAKVIPVLPALANAHPNLAVVVAATMSLVGIATVARSA